MSSSMKALSGVKTNESTASNALFTAGISSLIIGLLAIAFGIAFVVICRFRRQKREQMRNNDSTEFAPRTNSSPIVTDNYDSLNTTAMGPVAINETQADSNISTYEECLPVTNTDHTYNSLNIQPRGPVAINETQADSNISTYEECLPVTNIDHTYNSLNIQPREKKKLKKKEEIYENMKI